ncbi:Pol polyprotein [Plakobranchus ocellatus]|uniref:Pol polyprotein n=1 Tax=Plakobranchus ocellatus TaxID=259542 RepID=A0AAV4DSB2_9GAST|nr:Pol polyprotein [Plakobranchus ocellatus]
MPVSAKSIARESRGDKVMSQVISFVAKDDWPNTIDPEIHPFHRKRHEMTVRQDCRLWGHRVIPPQKLRSQMLETLHQGHLGMDKMKALARNYFWWPGLDKDIEAMSKSCSGCAMSQPDPPLSPLHPWQWPEKPWQRIHVDFAGPFLNSMFLVIVDAHTKWAEVIPTTSSTTSATINILRETFAWSAIYIGGIQCFHQRQSYQAHSQRSIPSSYKWARRANGPKLQKCNESRQE